MRRRRLLTTLICLGALGPATGAARAADCRWTDVPASVATQAQVSEATLCLLNEQRVAAGLRALSADAGLGRIAVDFAGQLASQRFFSHVSPSGQTLQDRLASVGYVFDAAGENLAWAGGTSATPAQIVSAWMNSAGHRANILDRGYREIGIGFATDGAAGGSTIYVTEFGTPQSQRASAPVRSSATSRSVARRRSRLHRRARIASVSRGQLVLVRPRARAR